MAICPHREPLASTTWPSVVRSRLQPFPSHAAGLDGRPPAPPPVPQSLWPSPVVRRVRGGRCGGPAGLRCRGGWALLAAQPKAQPQPQAAGGPGLLAHALQVAHVAGAGGQPPSALWLPEEPRAFSLGRGGGGRRGPSPRPGPHTHNGTGTSPAGRLQSLGSTPTGPEGGGPDAWVPL